MAKQLIIYTDGAARGNPGRGGYGVVLQWGESYKEFAQGYRLTTNNRMELLAVVVALQKLTRTGLDVVVYSDSSYVVDAVEKGWLKNWQRINFKDKKNADLWKLYIEEAKNYKVKFIWVKGHADNKYNNRCDQLATAAADGRNLLIDEGYEAAIRAKDGMF